MESRFAISSPESATNLWKTLGRYIIPPEVGVRGGVGEVTLFSSDKYDSDAHSYTTLINMNNLGILGSSMSGMLCFVTFATVAFTPELYFFTVFILVKTPEFQRHLC